MGHFRFNIDLMWIWPLISLIYVNQSDDVVCHGTLHKIADHDGVLVSFNIKCVKQLPKTRKVYDYKNADVNGLINYIKQYDFENVVFSCPVTDQTEMYTNILKQGFDQFVPQKTITIRPTDAPWCNAYTRLLLRKKNRNYQIYKKCETDYKNVLNFNYPRPENVTRYLTRRRKIPIQIKTKCRWILPGTSPDKNCILHYC